MAIWRYAYIFVFNTQINTEHPGWGGPGTYKGEFKLGQSEKAHAAYGVAPLVSKTETLHIF